MHATLILSHKAHSSDGHKIYKNTTWNLTLVVNFVRGHWRSVMDVS